MHCPTQVWATLKNMSQALLEAVIDAKLAKLKSIQVEEEEKVEK